MDGRQVIRMLKAAGWEHVSTRGDHHKFRDPRSGKITVLQHPRRDIPTGTLRAIARQTGIKFT